MKKQWLSIVLVLCMVLCMAPTTARAAEGETGTLEITVDISGVYEGDNVGDKTFSFEILRKYANYGHYDTVNITIKSGETAGTVDVPVEEGTYIVKQTSHATIDKYDWKNASHQPGSQIESIDQEVYAGKTKSVTVHNFYKIAVTNEITELPIKINGYALNAKVGDIKASTDQMRVTIPKVTVKQLNASGVWEPLESDATIQADTQYAVEILVNAKTGYTYAGLTGDNVTVNGAKADTFDSPWNGTPTADMRVFHELEVLKTVKKVKSIKITKEPDKTTYNAGDKFDPKGMEVTAVYKDDTTAVLPREKYTIFHGDKLTQGQTYVTIQYNDGSGNSGIKVDQKITVGPYVGDHQHTYDDSSWYQDAQSHWHWCTDKECPDQNGSTKDLARHTFVWKVDKEATTTQTGLKHEECTVCGAKRSENTEIPATGGGSSSGGGSTGGGGAGGTTYTITVQNSKNGAVTASHKSAAKDTAVTLTVTPDKGYVLDTLTVLDSKDKAVKLTEKNGKYTFTMPAGKVTVSAAFKAAAPASENPFTDVPSGAYYEDAVIWAVKKGITSGTSATTFNPDGSCTRAQAVTFLWRAAGSPEPKSAAMPFTDVPADAYYAKAVAWAVENGITKGTSDTTFSPDASCTRAQIVTFLWRAGGSPAVSGNSAFSDVASDAYYAAAVAWAEKNGVTGGIGGGLFGSDNTCTRAQIVTFIYRSVK